MASEQPLDGSSSSEISGGSFESTVELNIKTLDSRTFSFPVDKNIGILAFKHKIASQTGVPVAQQRLIFRGKVLNDDHLLSEYNVENGDTLHLVERQAPSSTRAGTGEAASSNASGGHDYTANVSRNRIGQVAHSVVLGSLNVGESGEAMGLDLSGVIGAVLNSIGIGNMGGGFQPGVQASRGDEAEGSRANTGYQNQSGNQSVPWQSLNGQSNPLQVPLGAAIAVPMLNVPIPGSLNTLIEYMNRMEQALSENGDQHSNPESVTSDTPAVELPANSHGVPTVEALSVVLRHVQFLLGDHAVSALSRIASLLEQEGTYADPTVRGQVHTLSMRFGVAMQHLGALLLELGRTILTIRLGQSPAESFVHSGPAVYISPSGPSPIMVQPFPLQTTPFSGGSPGVAVGPIPIAMGPVGVGNAPRNVNIHIHTGSSLAPTVSTDNREGRPGDRPRGIESGYSDPAQVVSGISVTATAVPYNTMPSVTGPIQPGIGPTGASQPLHPAVAEINARLRSLVANMQNENQASLVGLTAQGQSIGSDAGDDDRNNVQLGLGNSSVGETSQTSLKGMEDQMAKLVSHRLHTIKEMGACLESNNQPSTSADICLNNLNGASRNAENHEVPSRSISAETNPDGSAVPLGLGLGGLIQKRRERQRGESTMSSESVKASNQNRHSRAVGQQVLQSLASRSTKRSGAISPLEQSLDIGMGATESSETANESADGQVDVANAVSQVLQSPALDGILAGVSQQTGIGSPDMMRNMLQQFTQNPALRNTMNQIAQQIDSHDLGSMLSGMGGGQGGGIDLAGMMQQMMPIVSQALGGVSTTQLNPTIEPHISDSSRHGNTTTNYGHNPQAVDLFPVVQRLQTPSSSEEIFRSLADTAVGFSGNTATSDESIVNAICYQEGLAQDFIEMLRRDISGRFEDELGS